MKTALVAFLILVGLSAGGCIPIIIPYPHTIVHQAGFDVLVLDDATGKPVAGALVTVRYYGERDANAVTNSAGRCHKDNVGEFMFFALMGPCDYMPSFPRGLNVQAPGYEPFDHGFWPPPVGAPGLLMIRDPSPPNFSNNKGVWVVRLIPACPDSDGPAPP